MTFQSSSTYTPSRASKIFTQYKLQDTQTKAFRICWLDKKVNVGNILTLKDIEGKYKVVERYGDIDADTLDLNHKVVWYSLPKNKD